MSELGVWLAGQRVATIAQGRSGMSMTYLSDVGQLGAPMISMSMPVGSRRYGNKFARPFFHGLLPEGQARLVISYDLGLDAADDMGLLRALGKDCAGALTIQSVEDPPPPRASEPGSGILRDGDIGQLIAALPIHPLGFDGETIRVSLAGMQPKLLLARSRAGTWRVPTGGVMSTHILKPASRVLPRTVENEAFCMLIANRSEVSSATTTVEHFNGRPVLVSRRYDRKFTSDGLVERIHQEDACQALSVLTVPPDRKYQRHTPMLSLVAVSLLLQQWAEPSALDDLLTHLAFNVVIGNADYHGKNISFLLDAERPVTVAPLYDAMSTVYYQGNDGVPPVDTELGLHIAGKTDIRSVTMMDIIDESARWGMRRARSINLISEVLDRVSPAIEAAASEVPELPEALYSLIQTRLSTARAELAGLT